MEVEIIKPMWFEGQPLSPGEDGQANPVVDMPVSDAAYLQGIGRVRAIVAEVPPVTVADAVVGDAVIADAAGSSPYDIPVPAKSKKS
jgi:hypothetical protein